MVGVGGCFIFWLGWVCGISVSCMLFMYWFLLGCGCCCLLIWCVLVVMVFGLLVGFLLDVMVCLCCWCRIVLLVMVVLCGCCVCCC